MKLANQVVSLELAKRLKELGVKQESYFYWIYTDGVLPDGTRDKIVAGNTLGDSHWELGGEQDTYSAYTVAELGEMLPPGIAYMCRENDNKWFCASVPYKVNPATNISNTEADARAKMLIYLLENKLITL